MGVLTVLLLPIIGSVLLAWGLFQVFMDMRNAKQRRVVDRLTESPTSASRRDKEVKESLLRRRSGDLQSGMLDGIVSRLRIVNKFQRVLDQADVNWSASRTLVNLTAITMLVGALMVVLQFRGVTVLGVAVATYTLPLLWLIHKRKKRIRVLVEQLPDVFDLMGQALRAGHALAGAIQLISQQMPEPVSKEFARVFQEQNLGIKIEDALKNMAKRVGLMDVRFFVTAVLIQRQTGGDLAEVLDNISGVIRDRIKLFGLVKALTAEGRLSGWVLLALPMVVFVMELVVNPKYANVLLDEPLGQYMLMGAGVAQILGLLMIQKIVNIKV